MDGNAKAPATNSLSEQVAKLERDNTRLRNINDEMAGVIEKLRRSERPMNLYICHDGRTWMDSRVYDGPYFSAVRLPEKYPAYRVSMDAGMQPINVSREEYRRVGKIGPYMVWEQVR